MTHLSVHRVSLSSIHSGTLVFSIKQFVPGFVSVLYEIASFSESENCNIIARLNGFLPFLCCNRFCYQPKREQQGRKIERVRTRNASRLSLVNHRGFEPRTPWLKVRTLSNGFHGNSFFYFWEIYITLLNLRLQVKLLSWVRQRGWNGASRGT